MIAFDMRYIQETNGIFRQQTPMERKRRYFAKLLADKHSLLELKIFNAVDYILGKWSALANTLSKDKIRMTLRAQRFAALSAICLVGWIAATVFILPFGLQAGTISLGLFIALVGSMAQLVSNTEEMSHTYMNLLERGIRIEYYEKFMALPEWKDGHVELDRTDPEICFHDVCFTYPETNVQVLNGVSFTIRPRDRVAIVGRNGAGKSTLIKLMLRLYRATSGSILINGVRIEDIRQESINRIFGEVFQDYAKYQLTIRENVAFGNIDLLSDDAAIKQAMEDGFASDMIKQLDQNLGKLENDGVDLSGGQWQRLAIARACLSDALFYILDEPTASLDPIAESELYQQFALLVKDRGSILVSHRLASATIAKKIIVLDNGRVAEEGTHEQLMKRRGLYARMFDTQKAWYIKPGKVGVAE